MSDLEDYNEAQARAHGHGDGDVNINVINNEINVIQVVHINEAGEEVPAMVDAAGNAVLDEEGKTAAAELDENG